MRPYNNSNIIKILLIMLVEDGGKRSTVADQDDVCPSSKQSSGYSNLQHEDANEMASIS
jgi:hypothetical protein